MTKAARKAAVSKRAMDCCEYCRSQERFSTDSFSVEHVVPRSQGGTDSDSNLAYACQGCNNHKYISTCGIDPLTGEEVSLFHPRKQIWSEHFVWNDEWTEIIGITPSGRVTVSRLKLNREGLVNLRRVLASVGKHPV